LRCTVVEVRAGQFVLDAGAKVLTKDSPKTVEGFGALPEYPQATVTRLFDHDAVVSCTTGRLPKIGDRVALIPNHVCPVSNLADEFVIVDSLGNIEDHWPIDARHRNR
jgi:D-serine deaminase-like pyridoxal phosphate-dependent protein